MRKPWYGVCVAAGLLAACSGNNDDTKATSAPPSVCNGPVVKISGAELRYAPLNTRTNQDYQRDGRSYHIVRDPSRFSQVGLAAISDAQPAGSLTAAGEMFDPSQLTAAHPTLPLPGYARITNLANGRMVVARINDRGPYGNDRVISLSRALADRLNTSANSKVRIDPIIVAADDSLSGPGIACVTVIKQSHTLPVYPHLTPLTPLQEAAPDAMRDVTPPSVPTQQFMVQVGAMSDKTRAQQQQQRLSQQFGIAGIIAQHGEVWRIQLGPFTSKAEASALQQRMHSEARLATFITSER